MRSELKWVRSNDGWIAGVCEGVGQRLGIAPNILRIMWLFSLFMLGTGLFVYILLALTLPREDQVERAYEPVFLGVCARLSDRLNIEIGAVRFLTVFFGLGSLGILFLLYFVGYFLLPDMPKRIQTRRDSSVYDI